MSFLAEPRRRANRHANLPGTPARGHARCGPDGATIVSGAAGASAESNDETLMAAARGGDEAALETLAVRYQGRVYASA